MKDQHTAHTLAQSEDQSDTGRIDRNLAKLLACPCDRKRRLRNNSEGLTCDGAACGRVFPIVGGVPILINEDKSVFGIQEILAGRARSLDPRPQWQVRFRRFGKRVVKYLPEIGANWKARQNICKLRDLLLERQDGPTVLVIGAGEGDRDLECTLSGFGITVVCSDVYFGRRIDMLADSHDLPFQAGSFDAVVCQSVLEHVVDPYLCVSEIHRVLKPRGFVYAEVPFMQQVHGKAHDFTRFTLAGLRRLFRGFELIDAGIEGGPGMALAWSICWFFRMLSASVIMEVFVHFILPFFIFWLKYIDYFFVNSRRAADGAAELYFLGTRSETVTPDREIIAGYWLQPTIG